MKTAKEKAPSPSKMSQTHASNFSFYSAPSTQPVPQALKPEAIKQFQKKAKLANLDIGGIQEMLPCSLEAVDNLDTLYVAGTSKLEQEREYAQSIPPGERRLISREFLNIQDTNPAQEEEVIAE